MQLTELFESSKESGDRYAPRTPFFKAPYPMCDLTIDPDSRGQSWEGFGTALTEAAAHVLSRVPAADRSLILDDYFNPEKNGFTICRIPLGSSDFSLEPWSTVATPEAARKGEIDMARFDALTMPVLAEMHARSKGNLKILISPWSPPAFMKDNGNRLEGGKLLREWWGAWAEQYALFASGLENRGFNVWAVTVQNEPEARQRWDSCLWTAAEEAEFAATALKPALRKHGHKDIKVLVWDHNRDRLWERASESMAIAPDSIDGFALHWYGGDNFPEVKKVAEAFPGKLLVFSEGCIEGGPRPGAWFSGERYAHNIIGDMTNGCQAWIDWNMALNTQGGPNHVGNYCDSPVLIDEKAGTYQKQSSFWAFAHFSRAIRPGSVRLGTSMRTGMVPASVDGLARDQIEATAWKNLDGRIVAVLTNRTEAEVPWAIAMAGTDRTWKGTLPPRGLQTLVWNSGK